MWLIHPVQQSVEWGCNGAESLDDITVKMCKTQEALEIFDRLGLGLASNGFHLILVHPDSSRLETVPYKLNVTMIKLTFLTLDIQVVVLEVFVIELLRGTVINSDIIHIHNDESVRQARQDLTHESLKIEGFIKNVSSIHP